MKHSFKKSVLFVTIVLVLAFSAVGVIPAYGGGGIRYAKPSATGTGDCFSWANACTLQTALIGAASGDDIWVMAGTHKPTTGPNREATFLLKNGVEVYGGFAGTETDLSQRDPAANLTTLSGDIGAAGNSDNSYHVVTASGTDDTAILDGFTITAGHANGTSPHDQGGGMYNSGGSPRLAYLIFQENIANVGGGMRNVSGNPLLGNCKFNNNSADFGGGMANWGSSPSLVGVIFDGNNASDSGGGMHNWNSSPSLAYATFKNNSTTNYGGGMVNDGGSNPTLYWTAFHSNSAQNGGGMYNISNITMTNGAFILNSATDNYGGMYNGSGSSTLTNVTFSGNSAGGVGGGMGISSNGSPTLTNVTFSGNSAGNTGGGLYNSGSSSMLTNITFSGNTSNFAGGGMSNWVGNPTLTNVTFSGNSAVYGGGMHNASSSNPTIRNTIFWGNTATIAGAQVSNDSSTPVLNDNVVQGGCPDGSTCTHIISDDPKLGTLGNYGGSSETIPLLAGSSAIDTGNDVSCPTEDQRGIIRPQGAHCDIGSYEVEINKMTFRSVGANDGWVLESGENTTAGGTKDSTATTLNLGDGAADKQYRAILHFNTSTLPDTAVITKVTLKIRKQGLVGTDPFTLLGGLKVDMRKPYFGTAVGLAIGDFQAAAGRTAAATFDATPVNNWYSALLNATGMAYVNKTGNTQFRLYFATDDNNDNAADYMKFFSGDYATASARPTLVIEYYVP